jgi:hypothetical protein
MESLKVPAAQEPVDVRQLSDPSILQITLGEKGCVEKTAFLLNYCQGIADQ